MFALRLLTLVLCDRFFVDLVQPLDPLLEVLEDPLLALPERTLGVAVLRTGGHAAMTVRRRWWVRIGYSQNCSLPYSNSNTSATVRIATFPDCLSCSCGLFPPFPALPHAE